MRDSGETGYDFAPKHKLELPKNLVLPEEKIEKLLSFLPLVLEFNKRHEKKVQAGSWVILGAYLNMLFGKERANLLKPGDLSNYRILEVGAGTYQKGGHFGPNLARVLLDLGANVEICDPHASAKDFSDQELLRLKLHAVSLDDLDPQATGKFDLVLSSAFFGLDSKYTEDQEVLEAIKSLEKFSDAQIHFIQGAEVPPGFKKRNKISDDDSLQEINLEDAGSFLIDDKR